MRHSALVSAGASCATWSRLLGCLILGAALHAGEAAVRWQDASPSVTEGSGPLTTHLMVTPPASSAVTVVWKTNAESASAGTDYVDATTTTVIPAGQSRTAVSVGIVNDAYNRGSRTFGLQILSISGANWGSPNYVSATIADDDTSGPPATAPAVSWTPASTNVPSGAGATGFTVSLAYAWTSTVAVQWHANAESAQAGVDFAAAGGILTFAPGETAKDAVVTILAGAKAGSKFGLQIDAITGGAWGTPNYQSITITGAQLPAATPVVSPPAGTYSDVVTATAATATAGATLRYRLDGTTPNAADAVMPAAGLAIDGPATLAVRAFASGMQPSATATAAYAFAVADLTADVASGTYDTPQSVTLASASPGVGIRYTLDGSAPTASSPLADGPVAVTRSATLRAIGMRDGWSSSAELSRTYVLAVAAPAADLASGTYTGSRSVTLSTTSPDADIRYTLDGSAPTAASPLATAPIVLPGSCTLKAVAMRDGWTASAVVSFTYRLRVPTPTVTPTGGTYYVPQTVAAAVDLAEAVIRYTTDGSAPTATSAEWPAAGLAVDRTTPLRLRAFKAGWLDSGVRSATYTLKVSAITATPRGGTYVGGRSVVLATTTPLAVIRYTTDGSVPTSASAVADGPISIDVTTVLRAVASRDGWADSSAFRTTYTIQVAPVVADLASGTYVGQRSVGLSCVTDGAEIRYTLDGSTPTAASSLYAGPIALPGSCTLKAVAQKAGLKDSAVLSRSYALRVEPVSASLPAGTYIGEQQVVLSTPTADAFVRYTLDGTAPSATNGETATGPVTIQGNKTLRAVAMRAGWRNSAAFSALYRLRVPAPTATPPAGTYAAWPLVTAQDADASATIRYTTGTSIPGSSSTVFPSGGLQLSKATTLNLIATRTGWTNSLVTTGAYALNLAPVAPPVAVSTDEDVAVAVAPVASDQDSTVLTWSIVAQPAHGSLLGFDSATGAATYAPAADWNGTDGYTIAVADELSAVPVAVVVTVRPVDDPATAVLPADVAVQPGSDVVLDLLAADADSAELTATLTVAEGTVRLPGAAGLSVEAGDPVAGSATVAVRGPVAAVAAALRAVVVRAPEPFAGTSLALQLADPAGGAAAWNAPIASISPAAHAVAADGQTVIAAAGAARRQAGDGLQWVAAGDRLATAPYAVPTTGSAPAALEFDLDVARSGSYLLWARAGAAGPASTALRVSCADADHGAVVVAGLLPASAWANDRAGGGETAVSFAAPGRYRLRLEAPASESALDAILLLRDDAGAHADGDPWLPDGDGATIVIAAGSPHRTTGAAGRRWQVAAVSGREAVRSLPDIDGWSDPAAPGDASAAYEVLFMRAGTYRVWLLGEASDDRANSVHLGLDGLPLASARGLSWLGMPGWMWSSWSSWSTTPTITITEPGVHTVQLWSREDGSAIGQIRLSLVQSWTMPGAAVAATPRGLPYLAAADGTLALSPLGAHESRVSGASAWSDIPGGSGGARQLLPDTGLFFGTAQSGTSPRLSWHAWFPASGTYRFWVRAVGPAATGDSLFYGIDGVIGAADLSWLPVDAGLAAWGWSSRLGGSAGNATITVPAAGYHTINVWGREDGLALDRVLVQPGGATAPSGSGPADSEQDLPAPAVAN